MASHRLLGLMALLTIGSALFAFGCSSNGKSGDGDACGSACGDSACDGDACAGDACGGDPCGDPCGGACGGSGDALENKYSDSWGKALKLDGNADNGKKFFYEEVFDTGMACVACHSFDKDDTMTTDADGQVRPALSVYASTHRTNVKGQGSHNATLGGNMCVPYWQGGPKEGATPQQLADIDAWIKANGGDKDHATAANIEYKKRSFTIPETLTGGDAEKGAEVADKFCRTCHEVDGKAPVYNLDEKKLKKGSVPTAYLGKVAKRVKDKGKKNNTFMPGFPDERMSEQQLLDLLASFEKK